MRRAARSALACALWLACAGPALAEVVVTEPWVRPTVPGQTSTAAYLRIRSDADLQLVDVRSPLAQRCEVHETIQQQDVMRMRAVDRLDIPANRVVEFEQLHRHLMLQGLSKTLKAGDRVEITLTFVDAKGKKYTVRVEAPVRSIDAETAGSVESRAGSASGARH